MSDIDQHDEFLVDNLFEANRQLSAEIARLRAKIDNSYVRECVIMGNNEPHPLFSQGNNDEPIVRLRRYLIVSLDHPAAARALAKE
jgi:hypothetical protein